MNVYNINTNAYLISMDGKDLGDRDLNAYDITPAQAGAIAREALSLSSDVSLDGALLELYPGRGNFLLFVRFPLSPPAFFSFDSLEDLLGAVLRCPGEPVSDLFYIDGRYILSIRFPDDTSPLLMFGEFGTPLQRPAGYGLYLSEHGRMLARNEAVGRIKSAFVQNRFNNLTSVLQ